MMEGKVLIFKAVILSLILLVFAVFSSPWRFLANLERVFLVPVGVQVGTSKEEKKKEWCKMTPRPPSVFR